MVKNLEYRALVEVTVVVDAQVEVHGGNLEGVEVLLKASLPCVCSDVIARTSVFSVTVYSGNFLSFLSTSTRNESSAQARNLADAAFAA